MNNLSHTIAILAYNNHDLTIKNVEHLISLGYRENILLFDNGSNPSYEISSKKLEIRYQREFQNIYVNPAWNIIINQESCDYLTLLNNDCFILSSNYFNDALNHMEHNDIGITSCKTKNIVQLKKTLKTDNYFFFHKEDTKLKYTENARRQGWLMTLNLHKYKQMESQIPNYLKLWYGDDWIWGQFILNDEKYGVYNNRYAIHMKSTTVSSDKLKAIIEDDNLNLHKYGDWYKKLSPKLHIKSRLFNRYI